MTRLSKLLVGASASVALHGAAFADAPSGDPTAAPVASPVVAAPDPEDASAAWPQAIIDRPLTLGAGMIGASGSISTAHANFGAGPGTNAQGASVSADYGVTDELQVGAGYALILHDFEAKGPLDLHASYRLAQGPLKVAATAAYQYNLKLDGGYAIVGGQVAVNLAPTLSVYTPGRQLSFGVDGEGLGYLAVPVGVALQAAPNVYASAETILADFGLGKNASTFYISDITPLTLGVFVSPSNALDVGVSALILDLQHPSDVWSVAAVVRVFKI